MLGDFLDNRIQNIVKYHRTNVQNEVLLDVCDSS